MLVMWNQAELSALYSPLYSIDKRNWGSVILRNESLMFAPLSKFIHEKEISMSYLITLASEVFNELPLYNMGTR